MGERMADQKFGKGQTGELSFSPVKNLDEAGQFTCPCFMAKMSSI